MNLGPKIDFDDGCFSHFASQRSSTCALQMKDALYVALSTPMQFRYLIGAANNHTMLRISSKHE